MGSTSTPPPEVGVRRDVAAEVASLAGAANMVMAQLVEVTAAAIAAGETNEAGMKTPAAWRSPRVARRLPSQV